MADYTLDIAAFRAAYPAFASATTYPDATLSFYFDTAGSYVANQNYGCLRDDARYRGLTLMTAHLMALSDMANAGETPGYAQSASVDKISVSLVPPPVTSQFEWWLCQTAYGQQLNALLTVASAGGFFVGGSDTRGGFRGNSGYRRY